MENIEWHEAYENEDGVKTVAIKRQKGNGGSRIVGYNGILKRDKVKYKGKIYTVVMVSRLGSFGLSETGGLPYVLRVSPSDVIKQ
ncbi:hypothetical protein [Bacillus cytotoxicus]|uniref:hypothetical protein n=1 Tax=Bacillus cytotoxicus TaxID=580165 RepID=UPI0008642150|nr:hypothetical protein [Bacillus cytotoxicus]SCN38222.1 Uncharacterized protein BC88300_02585 [Bacillus cytotoxicus]